MADDHLRTSPAARSVAAYTSYAAPATMTEPADSLEDDRDQWREAVLITIAATLIRMLIAIVLPVFPDEAYYWDWSRNLAPGYFDHPPAIAWLIATGSALARLLGSEGNWTPSVRAFPVLAGGIGALFVTLTARHLGGGAAARRA